MRRTARKLLVILLKMLNKIWKLQAVSGIEGAGRETVLPWDRKSL